MIVLLLALLLQAPARPPGSPLPPVTEGDFVIKDFKFASGETLPELRIHYPTLGTPRKDAQGIVRNAVLIMHGTGGSGTGFATSRGFAGELFLPDEREIKRVPKGRAIVIPLSERTAGHGTHTIAALWKPYLEELLKQTEK